MSLYAGIELPGRPDLDNVARLDRLPIPMIRRMQRYGFAVDLPYLADLGSQLTSEMAVLEKDISGFIPKSALGMFVGQADQIEEVEGDPAINANSADQIRTLLFTVLGVGRGKQLKMTDTGKVSTGKKTLEMCRDDHPAVAKVLAYRERAKLKQTYVDALPRLARLHPRGESCPICELKHRADTWRVHSEFPTTRAETGRLACVAEWTPVTVKDESLQDGVFRRKPIYEVEVGDYVWTHRKRWRVVTAVWRKGISPMYNVTFSSGYVLTCTSEHLLLLSGDGSIQTMDTALQERTGSTKTLPIGREPDCSTNCQAIGNHLSEYLMGSKTPRTGSRVQSSTGDPVLSVEVSRQESNVRQERGTTPQLDRSGGRWVRVSDLFEGWQKAIRSSYRDGRLLGAPGTAAFLRCASYRRQSEEQRAGQPSFGYTRWAQENTLPTSEGQPFCYVEKIEVAGSLEVYDISVEEDESYEACGVFNHNSRRPNLQNIPLRSKLGGLVRAAFVASPGCKLVSVDFAQIELRDLAHVADCKSMIEVYEAGGDIHMDTAVKCFPSIPREDLKKPKYRVPAKTGNFGIAYQIGFKAFCAQLQYVFSSLYAAGDLAEADYRTMAAHWTEEECERFIARWFESKPEVRDYLDLQAYRVRRYGFSWDLFGRVRRVPEVRSVHFWKQREGVRQAGNMPIQSLSAGQTKLVMGELDQDLDWYRRGFWAWPLVPVHDQIIVEVEESVADLVGETMCDRFDSVMDNRATGERMFRVPIKSDVEITDRWVKE